MDNVVVIGSSGHAKVVIDIVQQVGRFNIVGLLDSFRGVGESTLGYKVLGSERELPALVGRYLIRGALIATGDNSVRSRMADSVRRLCPDLPFVSAVHPDAILAPGTVVGEGTVVTAGAVVDPGSSIGKFCIVNTKASLGHDSRLADFASLAPGVTVGGNSSIGEFVAIGIGATLIHGVSIGEHTVIGAGAVVTRPIGARVVAYGTPARVVRPREIGEKYL